MRDEGGGMTGVTGNSRVRLRQTCDQTTAKLESIGRKRRTRWRLQPVHLVLWFSNWIRNWTDVVLYEIDFRA